jgi:hypothetical protein
MGHGCTNYGGFGEKGLGGNWVGLGLDRKWGIRSLRDSRRVFAPSAGSQGNVPSVPGFSLSPVFPGFSKDSRLGGGNGTWVY